ncbi:SRPBCC family protein, partial [Gordonia aichiensis]
MTEVRIVEDCAASAETAFEYVNDYRKLPHFLYGIESFVPVTDQTDGLGATFDGHMKLGPASLKSRVEVVKWEKGRVIGAGAPGRRRSPDRPSGRPPGPRSPRRRAPARTW